MNALFRCLFAAIVAIPIGGATAYATAVACHLAGVNVPLNSDEWTESALRFVGVAAAAPLVAGVAALLRRPVWAFLLGFIAALVFTSWLVLRAESDYFLAFVVEAFCCWTVTAALGGYFGHKIYYK
ncbi:MAG: hypothetical protein NZ700_15130 [Gemmataceae bacterium]|nr:hypothetical protein [Gemmataceae bacterium]MDW8263888.1 hypothetical protein [Gemmataceae bacterium]